MHLVSRAVSAVAFGGAALLLGVPAPAWATISFGQLDDFQNGTAMSWEEGTFSPNPPTNIASGGPAGAEDHYLSNASSGGVGAGSKQVMFNQDQWTGNFNLAGVTRIDLMLMNPGATDLSMRIGLQGGPGFTHYASTDAVALPAGSGWQSATFNLTSSAMSLLSGADSLSTVLGAVTEMRLLSAAAGPAYNGDTIVSTLGVDNIRALRLPGDANFDGLVDISDLGILATNWQTSPPDGWHGGDFTFDGIVDISDLGLLATNWQTSVGSPSGSFAEGLAQVGLPPISVPEPAAAMAVAAAMLLRRRRAITSIHG